MSRGPSPRRGCYTPSWPAVPRRVSQAADVLRFSHKHIGVFFFRGGGGPGRTPPPPRVLKRGLLPGRMSAPDKVSEGGDVVRDAVRPQFSVAIPFEFPLSSKTIINFLAPLFPLFFSFSPLASLFFPLGIFSFPLFESARSGVLAHLSRPPPRCFRLICRIEAAVLLHRGRRYQK